MSPIRSDFGDNVFDSETNPDPYDQTRDNRDHMDDMMDEGDPSEYPHYDFTTESDEHGVRIDPE